jgi:ABC-type Mn2+/Zn2+ transport system ATPase subunit
MLQLTATSARRRCIASVIGISYLLVAGKLLLLLGPNGAGKTTLIRSVAGSAEDSSLMPRLPRSREPEDVFVPIGHTRLNS